MIVFTDQDRRVGVKLPESLRSLPQRIALNPRQASVSLARTATCWMFFWF